MSPAIAVLFTGLTAIFLIAHLKRPDRFYYILIKPNPRSWLVRGTWILMAYGAVAALWMALGVLRISSPPAVYALAIALALASAAYSAFLFGQAKGRDLWQSPLFIWILIAQTFVAGSAILLIVAPFFTTSTHAVALVESYFVLSLLINGSMILTQIFMPPYSEDVRYAVNLVVSGSLRRRFWWGVITMGTLLPLALTVYSVVASAFAIEVLAALMALVGLFIFDDVWITAGQAPPLS
jgi:formate-dependent nitrite reductase membrane component NrfD